MSRLPSTSTENPVTAPIAAVPVVGMGASAGGLAAFKAFFAGLPATPGPGAAFVLVQHLSPDHRSILRELIQQCTALPVRDITEGMVVRPNEVYVAPADRDVELRDTTLHLVEPRLEHSQRRPIDHFLRSLAQARGASAAAIILSGTGSDGTEGVRAISLAHGLVLAQEPGAAEFDGMPRSALATGLVDGQLPAPALAARVTAWATGTVSPGQEETNLGPAETSALSQVHALLHARTGHDFSLYKAGTINRRIERRMALQHITTLGDYAHYLEGQPAEVDALFRDLLIGVTQFFRDPAVFDLLEQRVIPQLLRACPAGEPVRIWVPGCSTGEEAYSLGMLLLEHAEATRSTHRIQIFATDIDPTAIARARTGRYPASIAEDLTPARLVRHFTAEPGGETYRIHKALRDLVVFSEQDIVRDPPFSQLDLISCRNLLIYMGPELQRRIIPLFHYALKPGGMLLLGSSEGTGEHPDLFAPLDRQSKVYQRRELTSSAFRVRPGRYRPQPLQLETSPTGATTGATPRVKRPFRELTERWLLDVFSPAGALVNREGELLFLHGRTGRFLEPPAGEAAGLNLLRMAREDLRPHLTLALRTAVQTGKAAGRPQVRIEADGVVTHVDLRVLPVTPDPATDPAARLFLVVFQETTAAAEPRPADPQGGAAAGQVAALREELREKESYLRSVNTDLQSTNERLTSANEEMQSLNEELQSANEELETSKEEMQSLNEELATVNAELQNRVSDLSRSNNDMLNLLAGTGIATVFLDPQLRILRFTPSASAIINLIPADVGRPVAHLVSNLVNYDRLVADAQAVLATLEPRSAEVQTRAGAWYAMQVQPYRTLDNTIEGTVITFVDITGTVRARETLKQVNSLLRLAVVVRESPDALTVQALDGRLLAWNQAATALYGWSEAEALAMNTRERIPPEEQAAAAAVMEQLLRGETLAPFNARRRSKSGAAREVSVVATALRDEAGRIDAIATRERSAVPSPAGPGGAR